VLSLAKLTADNERLTEELAAAKRPADVQTPTLKPNGKEHADDAPTRPQ
jgi:hypothetical protein